MKKNNSIEIARDRLLQCATRYLDEGSLVHVAYIYRIIGDREKAINCGDECFKVGRLDDAVMIYKDYKEENAISNKLIQCGDVYIRDNEYGKALDVYEAAGTREKLIKLGDKCLKDSLKSHNEERECLDLDGAPTEEEIFIDYAIESYKVAGVKEKLIIVGDECLKRGNLYGARDAFKVAGDREKLILVGNRYLKEDDLFSAMKTYKAANDREKIIKCGKKLLKEESELSNKLIDIIKTLVAVGFKFSEKKLIEYADQYLERSEKLSAFFPSSEALEAIELYKMAGARDKLIQIGDKLLDKGNFADALEVYKSASATRNKFISLGNKSLENGDALTALKAYKTAGLEILKADFINWGDYFMNQENKIREILEIVDEDKKKRETDSLLQYGKFAGPLIDEYGHWILKGSFRSAAIKAYIIAGAKDKIVQCGDEMFKEGDFADAVDAYEAAGDKEKLIELGDLCFKQGNLEIAERSYEAAYKGCWGNFSIYKDLLDELEK